MQMADFFFFKQKTAYEVRISDLSSDVCSSDLRPLRFSLPLLHERGDELHASLPGVEPGGDRPHRRRLHKKGRPSLAADRGRAARPARYRRSGAQPWAASEDRRPGRTDAHHQRKPRSEEHTSELQSLMRISYAVFCL